MLHALIQNRFAARVIRGAGGIWICVDGDLHPVCFPLSLDQAVFDQKALVKDGILVGPGDKGSGPELLTVAKGAGDR